MDQEAAQHETAGKPGQLFAATQWTVVMRAKDDSAAALNALCAAYRSPLLVWSRCRGQSAEDAEDQVQGFFERLLKGDFLRNVGREKGRFRTFLLTSFQNYLHDLRKRAMAGKRGGGEIPLSLDETNEKGEKLHQLAADQVTPDEAYDREWARTLLAYSLQRLEQECAVKGHQALCEALEPVLFSDPDAPAYAQIGHKVGLSEAAVKMAALRFRQRLKGIIREEVMQTVSDAAGLQEELGYLRSLFGRSANPA
jgi:DNA-directed RNA polymerase specialized sigma24 family protein